MLESSNALKGCQEFLKTNSKPDSVPITKTQGKFKEKQTSVDTTNCPVGCQKIEDEELLIKSESV